MQSNPALDFSVRESEFFQQLLARIGSARPRKLEIGAAVMMHSLPPPHSSKLDGHHGIIQSYDSDHDSWMIGNVSGYDSSDDDGPDAEEEDDMHDLEHSSVTVGEDEMRARIADAMRGLHRLEHMNIDPRELPTIRALFVRWSITQWTLEGTHGAQRPWTPQGDGLNKAPVCQTGIGHSLPASGKVQHSVSRQKRTRDDREWDESPECAQLGTIRGSGCCIVKARCAGIPRG